MIKEKSYAKINIGLKVTKKLDNGYHLLDTIMISLDYFDELEFIEAEDESIVISNVDIPGKNIIIKTIDYIKQKYNVDKNVIVKLNKNIFLSSGLAGGSGNAAATIRALNTMWNLNLSTFEIENIAYNIGADVTYCLYNKPARAKGIGEKLEFIENNLCDNVYCLVINPKFEVSTKEVFEGLIIQEKQDVNCIDNIKKAFQFGNLNDVNMNIENDLESVTFNRYNELFTLKRELDSKYNCNFNMTGSGPTLYLLTDKYELLTNIEKEYNDKCFVKVCRILK